MTLESQPDGQVIARCPCPRLRPELQILLTEAQAEELLLPRQARRNIAVVLPNHPPVIREVFLSGTTPAEWDADFRMEMRPADEYLALGYSRVDPQILENDPRHAEWERTGLRIKA